VVKSPLTVVSDVPAGAPVVDASGKPEGGLLGLVVAAVKLCVPFDSVPVVKFHAPLEFDVAVPMTRQAYVAYVMSETGVELAVARGISEAGIREWCESSLAGLLTDAPRDVLFDAYLAFVRR